MKLLNFFKALFNLAGSKIALVPDGYLLVPMVPTEEHIQSMCVRFDHSHNLKHSIPQEESDHQFNARRRFNRSIVLQLYEEATGQGFYRHNSVDWMQPDDYVKLSMGSKHEETQATEEFYRARLSSEPKPAYDNPQLEECDLSGGLHYYPCRSCGENTIVEDPDRFDTQFHYCGRSFRCIP